MKGSVSRTLLAGFVGGLVLNLFGFLTFQFFGGGILLDPSIQSPKLIAVWTEIDPLPLAVTNPITFAIGLVLFGIGQGFVYRWVSPAWPDGVVRKAWRMALLVFFLSYTFFEFFTPFNLLGEPIALIFLELLFWAIVAITSALAIAVIAEGKG